MKEYNKLVRDKIPQILDEKRISYEMRIVNHPEYKEALIDKLSEELNEFTSTPNTEELADILEVVIALSDLPEYERLDDVRRAKKEEKGGFEKRIVLKGGHNKNNNQR